MSLSSRALDRLREHWAVKAVPSSDLKRSDEIANYRLAQRAVGEQVDFLLRSRTRTVPFWTAFRWHTG